MKIRFFALLLMGVVFLVSNMLASNAFAVSNQCDVFLASVVSEAESSEASAVLAKQITGAKQPVNPFRSNTDTLSFQVSQALEKILAKISKQEWAEI